MFRKLFGNNDDRDPAYMEARNSARFTNYGNKERTYFDLYSDEPDRGGRYLGTVDNRSGKLEFRTNGPEIKVGKFD